MQTFESVQELTRNIYALLCEKDKEVLYKYASLVPESGVIVDIGTARGGSAFIMALASNPSVKIYTIDPEYNAEMHNDMHMFNLDDRMKYIVNTSLEAFETWSQDIDMLFIDGVHSYDGVKTDFETFGSRVKKGGIVAFHDVLLYDNTIGLAVADLVKSGEIEELETVIDTYHEDPRKIGLFVGRKL